MNITVYRINPKYAVGYGIKYTSIPEDIIVQEELIDVQEFTNSYNISANRGKRFNIKKAEKPDFDNIKDVHFIRDTIFDRDFFRRTFPNINIRLTADKVDAILFDEKSIFKNDSPGSTFYKTAAGRYFDVDEAYRHFLSSIRQNLLELNMDKTSIVYDIFFNSPTTVVIHTKSEYLEKLIASGKPFIHTSDILRCFKQPNQLKELSCSEAVTLFNQVMSTDDESSKAGMETLLMYDNDKYLPVKLFAYLCKKNSIGWNYKSNSKKLDLFIEAFSKYINYVGQIHAGMTTDTYLRLLTNFNACAFNKETDFKLLKDFILSKEVVNKFKIIDGGGLELLYPFINFTSGNLAAKPIESTSTTSFMTKFAI